MNTYGGITDCYDLLMRAGYYEHDAMAKAATNVLGPRKRVLELGVGTGLFAQQLLETNPSCQVTGIDFTPSMLEVARARIGEEAELIEADVTEMDLERRYDAAISSGGVWVMIHDHGEFLLGTHLFGYDDEVQGLSNVADHLESDGLLLLSIQGMHTDFDQQLDEGVVYSQRVTRMDGPDDGRLTITKHYQFTRGSDVLAEETLELGFYRQSLMDRIVEEAGFTFDAIDDDSRFFIFTKDASSS
jgi:SAM-dependent methyltransferase